MSFNFGNISTTKAPASGFTLPSNPTTTTAATTTGLQFNFGAGDNKTPTKPAPTFFATPTPSTLFSTPTPSQSTLSFGATTKTAASTAPATTTPSFGFGAPLPTSSTVSSTVNQQFGLSTSKPGNTTLTSLLNSAPAAATTASSGLSFGVPSTTTTGLSFGAASTTSTGLSFGATSTTSTGLSFGVTSTTTTQTTTPALPLSTSVTSTSSLVPRSLTTTSVASTYSTSTLPSTGSLTFGQLEDSINKWTIDLEEQGKFFINQAKQLNAWDSLLITNAEKILNLNGTIERVKQQQQQLDQELDFVLAQQKELEELIVPLEKELLETPVTDIDRNQMYQFSEIIDSQLKQMSDDLKEIIEHINETNKEEEASNPFTQISRILNAHMNSLQWLDRNTAQISSHLEQISKIQDTNRRNFTLNHSFNGSFNI